MVALRSLDSDEREEMLAELAETRRARARIVGAIKQHPDDSEKLLWQLAGCDNWIAETEKKLA